MVFSVKYFQFSFNSDLKKQYSNDELYEPSLQNKYTELEQRCNEQFTRYSVTVNPFQNVTEIYDRRFTAWMLWECEYIFVGIYFVHT